MNKVKELLKQALDLEDMDCRVEAKINDALNELEELIKPKSCDDCMFNYCGCSVQDSILKADNTATFKTFCCNSFKKKDNA